MGFESGEIILGDSRISFSVTRSRRRRRTLAFVMETPSSLKITAPFRASLSSIHSVIQKQRPWILRRLAEFQKVGPVANLSEPRRFTEGAALTYLGRSYRLEITQDNKRPAGCRLLPRRLAVNLHAEKITEDEVRMEILLWLKKRAKAKMQKRMDVWAGILGVSYKRMVIAKAERRWGSCNVENVIRLNWRLIMAPLPILDYVVVHELCHVRHKNHGPRFWRQVESVMPDYKNRRKHLHIISGGLVL